MIAAEPTKAAVVVIRPVALERVQPLHPRLASKASDPTEKPMLIRACGPPVFSDRNMGGAAGWETAVSIVAATTVTTNDTADVTARPMVNVINRLRCPSVSRVARKVAAKPPRKALSDAS